MPRPRIWCCSWCNGRLHWLHSGHGQQPQRADPDPSSRRQVTSSAQLAWKDLGSCLEYHRTTKFSAGYRHKIISHGAVVVVVAEAQLLPMSIDEFGGNPPHAPHANKVYLYTPEILIRTRKTTQNNGSKRQLALLES